MLLVNVPLVINDLCFELFQRMVKTFTFIIYNTNLNIYAMSLKYSTTTADRLDWDEMINLVRKLEQDKNYKFALFIALGSFWGLRVNDMKALVWEDVLDKDEITIVEHKTGKKRLIPIKTALKKFIKDCYSHINPVSLRSPLFISQKGTVYSTQRLNVVLKEIKEKYKLNIKNFSCHSLRKTFGREVYNQNLGLGEQALVMLMDIFNHSSIAVTKRYIGLRQEEVAKSYEALSF